MSLNCSQLKTKYEELLSEKDSFVLEYEKFKNGGDAQKLKELKARLEKNTKEIREVLMYPGYVFDTLKVLASSNNVVIQDIDNICNFNSKGELVGEVRVDLEWYLFHGDTLVGQIAGQDFVNVHDIHTQPNDDLAGKVEIAGKMYPFYGDTIVRKIANEDFEDVLDIHTQPSGELAGRVKIDGKWCLFHGDTLVGQIAGKDFEDVFGIYTQPSGDLAGRVQIAGKTFPFIFDGEKYVLVDEINKEETT